MTADLKAALERYADGVPKGEDAAASGAFERLKAGLNAGVIRAAERDEQGVWRANAWVKAGILLGFRLGRVAPTARGGPFPFYDKDTWPLKQINLADGLPLH